MSRNSGSSTGSDIKVGKHDAYIATPDESNAHKDTAILYIPDVLGIWQNSKLIADQFAANGYLTLIVDLFNGDPVPVNPPEGFDLYGWLENGTGGNNPHTQEYIDPIVAEGIKFLKTEKGVKKLGAAGYCLGAKVCSTHRAYALVFTFPSLSPSVSLPSTLRSLFPT
jgi:dienelactone hydrolase